MFNYCINVDNDITDDFVDVNNRTMDVGCSEHFNNSGN